MFAKTIRKLSMALVTGSIILQGCAVGNDELQNAAASSVKSFVLELFTIALGDWINTAFDLS